MTFPNLEKISKDTYETIVGEIEYGAPLLWDDLTARERAIVKGIVTHFHKSAALQTTHALKPPVEYKTSDNG